VCGIVTRCLLFLEKYLEEAHTLISAQKAPLVLKRKRRWYTEKKENKIFLIYREIQTGAFAKSYMKKGFLIYEDMRKYLVINEEAVSHI
jgi:hypothetical protein